MSELLARALALKSFNKDARSVDFIASTDAIDSYDEVVEQDWVLDRYLSNPVVLFGHNSRDLPIGKATRVEVVNANGRKQLECTIQIASAKANPMAEQVWNLIEEGALRAVSVGFMPGDYRLEKRNGVEVFVLSKNTLHEISVVPIPANPEALAKMKSKARTASTTNQAVEASTKEAMDIKELTDANTKLVAEKALVDAKLAEAHKDASTAKAALLAAEGTIKALEGDRDGFKARAEKAEAMAIEAEVDALVGIKITPAEKPVFLELATTSRKLFKSAVEARPAMKLTEQVVKASTKLDAPTGDASTGLANLALKGA